MKPDLRRGMAGFCFYEWDNSHAHLLKLSDFESKRPRRRESAKESAKSKNEQSNSAPSRWASRLCGFAVSSQSAATATAQIEQLVPRSPMSSRRAFRVAC